MIPTHRVGSWDELNARLYERSWNASLRRFRSPFAFRGMDDAARGLETSLMRLGGDARALERALLRTFRKYARRHVEFDDRIWSWLAVAQHHGLPTRLLDWTFSPYVAVHFATADPERFGADGVVWCVDYRETNALLPERLRAVLAAERADVFTAEMLARAASGLDEFDELAERPFVTFFEPPSMNDRLVNQYALLSLTSSPVLRLDRWLEGHPGTSVRLVIPAELKWEVRDKLDQANITERVLFPGLDGLSAWLRRYYTPRS